MAKRISYRDAVDFIAMNDGPGDTDALEVEHVASMCTTVMLASISGKEPEAVARDVIRYRRKFNALPTDDRGWGHMYEES